MIIGIATTLWKRHEIERLMMEYYVDIDIEGIELVCVAAGSEGDTSKDLAESCGWEYVKAKNNPVSDKFNKAISHLNGRVDAVVIIGSDDFLSPTYFTEAVKAVRHGAGSLCLEHCHYIAPDGECYFIPRSHPGAGTFITAPVLDRMGWEPYPSGINDSMDGPMHNRIHTVGYPCAMQRIRHDDAIVVDVKSGVNIWDIERMIQLVGRGGKIAPAVIDKHFPDLRENLNKMPVRYTNG